MSRATFQGSGDELCSTISQYATERGFLSYRVDGKVDVDKLRMSAALLVALRALQPNLSFQKRKMEAAMASVLKDCRGGWPADVRGDQEESWIQVSACRLRLMCRHVRQAEIRGGCVNWYRDIFGESSPAVPSDPPPEPASAAAEALPAMAQEAPAAMAQEASYLAFPDQLADTQIDTQVDAAITVPETPRCAQPRSPTEWLYGYDPDLQMVWRADIKSPAKMDYTRPFSRTDQEDKDFAFANFGGEEVLVPDITVAEVGVCSDSSRSRLQFHRTPPYQLQYKN